MTKLVLFPALLIGLNLISQTFVPNDTILGSNLFQVEFSTDGRSMVWCEAIGGGKAKVWYTDVDLNTGLPNLTSGKQLIDTIQNQGWPYWGQDNVGKFFLIKNQYNQFKYIRRTGFNTLSTFNLGTINNDVKSLINVNADSTKNYFWVSYVIKDPNIAITTIKDSLFVFKSNNPSIRYYINSEFENNGGSAYELTFPRWLAQSELLAYPFRPNTGQPVWDIKFWNGQTQTSKQVSNDIVNSPLNHHVDDLPFRLTQFPADTFMFSARSANKLSIYKKTGQYFTLNPADEYLPISNLSTTLTLTSFEPFTICGNKTYGAYQVYTGAIPGNTAGEIWLKGIFNDPMHVQISNYPGEIAVDPEYVIGKNKVWVFYYGKVINAPVYNLHRCSTPLLIPCSTTGLRQNELENSARVYPNPFANKITINNLIGDETFTLTNVVGKTIYKGKNIQDEDFSILESGLYFLKVNASTYQYQTIKLLKN